MRRILIITYHFPPDGAVGGLRWAGMGKYLARRGWSVHVLTASEGPVEVGEAGLHVHRVPRRRTLDDVYNDFRTRESERTEAGENGAAPASAGSTGDSEAKLEAESLTSRGPLSIFRREFAAAMAFPDYSRGWLLRAAREARRLIRRHEIDCVITSGPPHSAHLVGALAAAGTPLVLDFRDPWLHQLQRHRKKVLLPATLDRWAEPRLAGFAARAAAGILATTADFAAEQAQAHPGLSVHHLPNGVDPERLPPTAGTHPSTERVVSHVGSLYLGRDLGPVLRAMGNVAERRTRQGVEEPVRLRVAGRMEGPHREQFFDAVEASGVQDRVDVLGLVPESQALDLVRSSRLSLVLAQKQKLQIPAKLYESVALGIPTLVIAERDSASFREAKRLGAYACEPEDVEGIAVVVDEATRGDWPGPWTPAEPVDHERLAGQLAAILDDLCGKRR